MYSVQDIDTIMETVIRPYIDNLNLEGRLDEFLLKMRVDYCSSPTTQSTQRKKKYIVLGDSEISKHAIESLFESILGIAPEQLELVIEYGKVKNFNFSKCQKNPDYEAIIVGPMPHKTTGTNDYSSTVVMMEDPNNNFPHVVRCGRSGSLKISRSSLKSALKELEEWEREK